MHFALGSFGVGFAAGICYPGLGKTLLRATRSKRYWKSAFVSLTVFASEYGLPVSCPCSRLHIEA